jgi:hypothetical protein
VRPPVTLLPILLPPLLKNYVQALCCAADANCIVADAVTADAAAAQLAAGC